MTAFLIAQTRVHDAAKMQAYAAAAGPTIAAHGGKVALRGAYDALILGAGDTPDAHGTAVIEFADMDSLKGWFSSDAYQALSELRDAACDMQMTTYQVPA